MHPLVAAVGGWILVNVFLLLYLWLVHGGTSSLRKRVHLTVGVLAASFVAAVESDPHRGRLGKD
jgi:hypothetical protein